MSRMTDGRRSELHEGVLTLLAEHGYDNVTMDQIAEHTRSSKATLYRQWGSKTALVVEAITCLGDVEGALPDTGSLREDLHEMIRRRPRPEDGHLSADLITAMLNAMRTDDELAAAVRRDIVGAALTDFATVVDRAVERGEVAADNPARDLIGLTLLSPFVLHHVVHGTEPSDDDLFRQIDAVVLPALGIH